MLRISKLTDYAVVVSTHLAGHPGRDPVTARDIARDTRIPEPTVGKVLKALSRAGVLESQRGARGGYRLSRSPEEIGVVEVITAIEGPIAITECTGEETAGSCGIEGSCEVRGNWQRINGAIEQALHAISLADMACASQPSLVALRVASTALQRRAKRHQLDAEPARDGGSR